MLSDPLVLGHEVSGRIAAVGQEAAAAVAAMEADVGTPVTLHPATLVCDHKVAPESAGRTNLWPEVRYFGSAAFQPHEQGAFSRYRTVRPDQLRIVPEGVSLKEAALAEPFGVALHALSRAGDVNGKTVLVLTREIDYRGSHRFIDEISTALELMADGLYVSPLMTHEVGIEDAVHGFELAADRSTGSSKVMIRLS